MGRAVVIDGPSGAGKSTLARMLADRLGFRYLDTGALYRAVALGLRKLGIPEDASDREIADALAGMRVEFACGRAVLNGEDVSEAIRTPEIGHYSSVFSARRPVRDYLLPVQRAALEEDDLVAEGRDMGTVVFPSAWRKFYLDASVEARALRRQHQLGGAEKGITFERAYEDVSRRDERDSGRDIAPLKRAGDAFFIDSSTLSADEVLVIMFEEMAA